MPSSNEYQATVTRKPTPQTPSHNGEEDVKAFLHMITQKTPIDQCAPSSDGIAHGQDTLPYAIKKKTNLGDTYPPITFRGLLVTPINLLYTAIF